jgi:hypothetical protein
MTNYEQNESIHQAGCGVLNALTRTTDDYSQKNKLTELEIMDAIINTFLLFPSNYHTRLYVSKTFYKMSRWDVLCDPIRKKGGRTFLKKILKLSNNDDDNYYAVATRNFATCALCLLE